MSDGARFFDEMHGGADAPRAPYAGYCDWLGGEELARPPVETALGALLNHITGGADAETFQPMNVNFGLMPPPPGRAKKADRKKAYTERARAAFSQWLHETRVAEPA